MKKIIVLAFAASFAIPSFTQDSPYQFTQVKNLDVTATEDQSASGTCWSFATISFLESEIIRKGNAPVDLSEMYNVRMMYPRKTESYVRFQGKQQFGPGGLMHDVLNTVHDYGMVPEPAYTGLDSGKTNHDHGLLDIMLESIVKTVLDKKLNEQNNEWRKAVDAILDEYLGVAPSKFEYAGKQYTPASFRDAMGIKADDYVSITSFSHHPFYSQFVLEVPDNWAKGNFYNVPLDDLQKIADHAIENGYTVAWDADVSEKGFSFKNGIAVFPTDDTAKEDLYKKMVSEKNVDQPMRQYGFDSFQTTDDHLMHITGKAKDQNGTVYYTTKNSWGTGNAWNGYQQVSQAYFRMKTIGIVVHKDALPKDIRKKMGI
ncbi:MAG: C1 family peptidase [Flavobacteriales bacterium]|nr:C1 family peptidase [Flavobacteriales bacterium]